MSLLLLLLLLLVCSAQASHFYGTVMTYYPKSTNAAGSVTVVLRYKLNFRTCGQDDTWTCLSGNCGTENVMLHTVDSESGGEWCQREGIMTRQVPSNAPFQLLLDGNAWISNIQGITRWRAVTLVELRNRSDTGQANRSPQTTILPAVRVPSNCRRDFNLLAFDPDGDEVKCRYGNTSQGECNPCTQPPVLSISSSCTLSFSPTNSSNEGAYVVQLVMEDFPRQNITLTQTNGSQEVKTTNDAISKIPVQFAIRVDSAVPSCAEGLYLPKFLPPTPANRARLYTPVNQTLEISINAEANMSTISELLFSGPYNINQTTPGAGQFILRWTPTENEDEESHPICFVVQALSNLTKYHSELRCVIVTVGNDPTITATIQPATTLPTTTSTIPTMTTINMTTTQNTTTTPLTTTSTTPTTTTINMTTAQNTTTPLTTTSTTPTTTTITMTTAQNTTTTPLTTTSTTPTTTTITMTTTQNTTTTPLTTTSTTPTTTTITMTTAQNTTTPLTTTSTTPTTTTITMTTAQNTTTPLTTTSTTPTTTTITMTTAQNTTTTPLTTTSTTPTTTTITMTTVQNTTTPLTTTNTTPTTTTITMTTVQNTTTPLTTTSTTPTTINETTTQNTTSPLIITTTTPTITMQNTTTVTTTTTRTTTTSTTDPTPSTTVTSTTTPEATTIIATPSTTVTTTTTTSTTPIVVGLRIRISSSAPLSEDDIRNTVIQQLKDELVRRGLPSDITLRLVSSVRLERATTATPVVST